MNIVQIGHVKASSLFNQQLAKYSFSKNKLFDSKIINNNSNNNNQTIENHYSIKIKNFNLKKYNNNIIIFFFIKFIY